MPLTRRQIYRRRRVVVLGGGFALLLALAYLPLTLFAPIHPIDPVVTEPAPVAGAPASVTLPAAAASAITAVGAEGVLAQAGTTDPVPMASITKLVVALAVLDAHPLAAGEAGPSVTMTAEDARLYRYYDGLGASVAPVPAGATFTERELLEIMLLDSAGNYAVTIGNWAFGSPDATIAAVRAYLDRQGLTSIVVTEPTGRDAANVATASDLLTIGQLALANPTLAEIVAIPSVEIHDIGLVENSNKLLGDRGIDGLKTGTLNSFGANLLFSADVTEGEEQIPLVGVVLGMPTHALLNAAVRSMLDEVDAGYQVVPVITEGNVVGSYETVWGATTTATAAESASLVVWGDAPIVVATTVAPVQLARAGQDAGSVTFTAGHRTVTVPLTISSAVDDPGPWWRLSHPSSIVGIG